MTTLTHLDATPLQTTNDVRKADANGSSAALGTQRLERLHDERGGDVTGPPPRPPGAGVSPTSDFEGFGSFS
jgi:hypothetical protein